MYTKNMTITPADARLWLDTKNSRNRPVSENAVAKYAQELKAGRWKNNGQPVIFGKSGNLLNGQHRLLACVRSNTPFESLVTWGVEDDAFDTIDDCNTRSLADVLHIKGEASAGLLSAGLRFLWIYAAGEIERRDLRRGRIATKSLLEQTLDKHRKITNSVKFYGMLKARPGGMLIPAGMAIGLHYLCSLVDEKKADEFFTRFQSGFDLSEGDPIALLRARLIAGQKEASVRLTPAAMYFYMVTTWNAFASDTYLKRLMYNSDAVPPEIDNLPKKLLKDLL
jgi:hypothetical protein